MTKKMAIYDLDGTLVDTLKANFLAYQEALSIYDIELTEEFFANRCFGRSYRDFLRDIKPDAKINDIHNKKKEIYSKYLKETKLNAFLLDFIINNNYINVIATTASAQNCNELLEYHKVRHYFDAVYAQESVKNLKPHPEIFTTIINDFGINPENTIIFEDSDLNINNIKELGCSIMKVLKI